MNINFKISSGTITTDDGQLLTSQAFAGNNSRPKVNPANIPGRNNVAYVALHFIGPLPPGVYSFGPWGHHDGLGDHVSSLTMIPGTGTSYGRGGFYMHGMSTTDPLNSSEGCVCVPHDPRVLIESMKPDTLTVTA